MAGSLIVRLILLSTGLLAVTRAADDPWRYIDSGSKMLIGVEWGRILDSPAGVRFRQQLSGNLPVPIMPGMEGIESILIASPGSPQGRKGAHAPVLIVVSGDFDLDRVRAGVSKRSRRAVVNNVEIFQSPEKTAGPMGLALVSRETLLIGDVASLVRAVGRVEGRDSMLMIRGRQLADTHEFWMISNVPPEEIAGQDLPLPVPVPMDNVQSVEMGIAVADGFAMTLAMQMDSPDAARKVKSELAKAVHLAAKEKRMPEMAGMDKLLNVAVDGATLRIFIKLDAAGFEQRMAAFQSRQRTPAPAAAAVGPPVIARPTPNGKPVIWNLDPQDK